MKITKAELDNLIKESATRKYNEIILEGRKSEILNELSSMLDEEELEELFGSFGAGLKSVAQMGGQKLAKAGQNLAKNVNKTASNVANKVGDAVNNAKVNAQVAASNTAFKVKNAAQDIKNTYQAGVEQHAQAQAQQQALKVSAQIKALMAKQQELAQQYQQLTGKKFTTRSAE